MLSPCRVFLLPTWFLVLADMLCPDSWCFGSLVTDRLTLGWPCHVHWLLDLSNQTRFHAWASWRGLYQLGIRWWSLAVCMGLKRYSGMIQLLQCCS